MLTSQNIQRFIAVSFMRAGEVYRRGEALHTIEGDAQICVLAFSRGRFQCGSRGTGKNRLVSIVYEWEFGYLIDFSVSVFRAAQSVPTDSP